jgi:uncharacterized protein (TIGR02246 family)
MLRPFKIAASLAVGWLLLTAAAPRGDNDRPRDRAAIGRLLGEWEAAWNAHDMHRLAALFSEDAIWVLWTGDVWQGSQRFEHGMTEVHRTVYRDSIQHETLEELTFVGPGAAVLRFQSNLTGDTRYPDRTIHSRKILVLKRANGEWRIAWGQNTRFFADLKQQAEPAAAP